MHIGIKIGAAGLALFAAANATAQVDVFHPVAAVTGAQAQAISPTRVQTQRLVATNTASLQAMHAGDEAAIETPGGTSYVLTYERTETGYGGGKVWIGYVRGHGKDYPVLISTYAGQVDGSIATPGGKLRLRGSEDSAVLTDMQAAGEHPLVPTMDDIVLAPQVDASMKARSDADTDAAVASPSAAGPGNPAQIDVLILFSTQLQTQLGGYSATIARLNTLVATANTVYANSGIYASLNMVYAQPVNYSYADKSVPDSTTLSSLQGDTTVAALRNQYGADAVLLVRPFQANVCGLSYITSDFTYSGYAFSVVEDGMNGNAYCDITTLTHEVGHLMGAAHDVATSVQSAGSVSNCTASSHPCYDGYPSYNRGYCNGNAGTIMAYPIPANGCSPLAQYFSNPTLNTCNGGSCGVPIGTAYTAGGATVTGADSTTAINTNAPQMAVWRSPPNKFTSLVPSRVLDTRAGAQTTDGLFSGTGALQANSQLDLTIAGRGGVPANGAGAVVLNVTAANPSASGYLTAWPTGSTRPLASNINFVSGLTVPNLVVAKLSSGGQVSLYNAIGSTDVIADVAGWFPATSAFAPLVPARLLDTRPGTHTVDGQFAGVGALGRTTELDFTVTGRGGVPASGVGAVVLNLTATQPTTSAYITAWPAGSAVPNASNLNVVPNQTVANLAIVKVGNNGQVALFNSNGSTHMIADVAGWFPTASELTPLVPVRLLDTRPGQSTFDGQFAGGGAVGQGVELDFTVTGRADIPTSGVGAVVLNVTAVTPTTSGFLTVWPTGSTRPFASNLNFTQGSVVQNLVIAKVGTNGQVAVFNSAGSTYVVADAVGWFAASP
ncbi:MAG: hypothetical protein J0I77_21415 [Rudaea sp.]|uniref:M12 family metallo-peptidase n=1 Tax=unclassified Rudaea TaxID=2627037 RepID=UPI0010F82190|nr:MULTISPECIES: M12 family metallo-peptidase [unclassified Rudaea]MBN8888286.1 hypothetical protein [Rudaea sp.]